MDMVAREERRPAIPLRGVILGTLVVCLGVAMAPWGSGGQEPWAMLVSAFALLLGALLAWRQPEVRRLKLGVLSAAFGMLLGFGALSWLWSANRYSTAVWVAQWVMAGLAFRLSYAIAGEKLGREWVTRIYLASAAIFSVVAIGMYVSSTYDRLTGTFYWPNPAAAYLIPAIIMGVDRLRQARGKWAYLWGSASGLFLATFLLTDSRAATLVLLLVGALYLLIVNTPRTFWIRFVFTVLASIGLSIGIAETSRLFVQHNAKILPGSRLGLQAGGESSSTKDRLYYLGSALDMWFRHPLGGVGAGTYGDVHPQYQQRVVSASTDAHNLYVQTLAELGLVGVVALAGLWLWLLVGSLRGLVGRADALPAAFGGLALALHFGLDIDARYPALLMLAAALFGLSYSQWVESRRKASWGWPVFAIVTLVPIVSLYQSDTWATRAQAAQNDGDYATAADRYAQADSELVFNPDYVNAEGIDLYTEAMGGGPNAAVTLGLALDRARTAERLDPHDAQHHQLEGRVLALRGDWPGAEAAFRAALQLDPYNHPDYALDLASAQLERQNAAAALATVREMLALYPQGVIDNRNLDTTLKHCAGTFICSRVSWVKRARQLGGA